MDTSCTYTTVTAIESKLGDLNSDNKALSFRSINNTFDIIGRTATWLKATVNTNIYIFIILTNSLSSLT